MLTKIITSKNMRFKRAIAEYVTSKKLMVAFEI